MEFRIQKLMTINENIYLQIIDLLPQLSEGAEIHPFTHFDNIVNSSCSHLFCAFHDGQLVGMATLVIYKIPTGRRAIIEDFVVDQNCRGRKLGVKIMEHLIEYGRENGMKYINLTSNSARVAANKLYQALGFKKRDTNAYCLEL
jgi:ribosomal protein S18 acetylase RimI-like enzyme